MEDPATTRGITILSDQEARHLIELAGVPAPVSKWELANTSQMQGYATLPLVILSLTPLDVGGVRPGARPHQPLVSYWNRHDLILMARQILERLAPTPEDEILETLKQIEARLSESG